MEYRPVLGDRDFARSRNDRIGVEVLCSTIERTQLCAPQFERHAQLHERQNLAQARLDAGARRRLRGLAATDADC